MKKKIILLVLAALTVIQVTERTDLLNNVSLAMKVNPAVELSEKLESLKEVSIYAKPVLISSGIRQFLVCELDSTIEARNNNEAGSSVRMLIPNGSQVEFLGEEESGWINVRINETEGYVSVADVDVVTNVIDATLVKEKTIATSEEKPKITINDDSVMKIEYPNKSTLAQVVLYYNTDDLNVRKNADKGSELLGKVPAGTHLLPVSKKDGWYEVIWKDLRGWVSGEYLKSGEVWMKEGIVVANKGHELSTSFNPGQNPEATSSLNKMIEDAKKEKLKLVMFSGFRSSERQTQLYNNYVSKDGVREADTYSARPGYSEHQTGLAFDIGGADSNYWVSEKLGDTTEGKWMMKNAHLYGFIFSYPKGKEKITGYQYEPWHLRYVGKEVAEKIYQSGETLDEYLGTIAPEYVD